MKFSRGAKKYQQVSLLFFIASIAANAASIVEKDGKLLEEHENALAFSFESNYETITPATQKAAANSHRGINKLQHFSGESKGQKILSSLQSDKKESTIVAQSKENEQIHEDEKLVNTTANDINSADITKFNASQKEFYFNDTNTNVRRINQREIIENSQQLKMLAHNLFGAETLEDVLIAKQEVKMFFDQADAWIKEVIFEDSNWRLEDTIYGSAAIMFINDSSLIRFLRKLDGNPDDLNQVKEHFQQQTNNTDQNKDLTSESESGLVKGYFYIIDFWNKYASTIIYLVLSIIIINEVINLISKASQSKKKRNSGRRSRNSTRPVSRKVNTPAISLSTEARVIDDSSVKTGKRRPSSRRRSHSQRRQPKRSLVRKILDDVFADSTHKN